MNKDEWLKRCAARYVEVGALDEEVAKQAAESLYPDFCNDDTTPEEAADEDMTYWTDDGDGP